MAQYDPSKDADTRILTIQPNKASSSNIIMLPDGTKQVPMGSGIIIGVLGEGGMAIVYEIWNEQLGVKRAVKLLRPNSSQENKERFYNEIKITAQLDHPNIIDIHAVGEWHQLPYIEMEKIDGISLENLLKSQGALPLQVCTSIGIFICRALNYTHHHEYVINNKYFTGLLHRDLKPGNILISNSGIVRLTDFGIARPTNVTANTSSGKVIGSMQYLAPEQLEEDEIDTRADIFSFGCILYEMLCGEKTFPEKNITRLVRKRVKNEYSPLSSYKIDIPARLNSLIVHCLQEKANKRPSDIKLALYELEKIHNKITSASPEEIMAAYVKGKSIESDIIITKKSFGFWKVLGAVSAIILLSIGSITLYNKSSGKKQTIDLAIPSFLKKKEISKETQQNVQQPVSEKSDKSSTAKKAAPEQINVAVTSPVSESKKESAKNREPVSSALKPFKSPKTVESKRVAETSYREEKKNALKKTEMAESVKEQAEIQPDIVAQQSEKAQIPAPSQQTEADIPASGNGLFADLEKKYGTSDYIYIMKAENSEKHYDNILRLYDALPSELSSLKEARLLRHRAFEGTGKVNKTYFDNNHINDGEFYLSKAKFLFHINQYQRAIWILGMIKTAPTVLMNKKLLNQEVLYYLAKCSTGIFESDPSQEKKKTAMESWFNVKNEFRNNQDHPYFIEANKEIRNINKKVLD